jgi:hypothetical protein
MSDTGRACSARRTLGLFSQISAILQHRGRGPGAGVGVPRRRAQGASAQCVTLGRVGARACPRSRPAAAGLAPGRAASPGHAALPGADRCRSPAARGACWRRRGAPSPTRPATAAGPRAPAVCAWRRGAEHVCPILHHLALAHSAGDGPVAAGGAQLAVRRQLPRLQALRGAIARAERLRAVRSPAARAAWGARRPPASPASQDRREAASQPAAGGTSQPASSHLPLSSGSTRPAHHTG